MKRAARQAVRQADGSLTSENEPSPPPARRRRPRSAPHVPKSAKRVWEVAGDRAPDAGGQVTVDLDGVLAVAHSDKQDTAPIWKKTYGHHPFMGFVGHGPGGTGEPVAALLRPGNAGSNTAADHITAARLALVQWVRLGGLM